MQWIESRGFTPYGEIPWYNRAIDIVGLSDDEIWAVELKIGLTHKVLYQAHLNQLTAHRSWCAVSTCPRKYEKRLHGGIGLLVVQGGIVEVMVEAQLKPTVLDERRVRQIRGTCAHEVPNGPAGLPTMAGIGVAQSVYDSVQCYLAAHPEAKWKELFENVPNHYCHARSMQGAMRVIREVRASRSRRTAELAS